MSVTLDTNIYVSALEFGGMRRITRCVSPTRTIDVLKDDPDDNRILECAFEARSQYIITHDKDLLRLREFEGIRIFTAHEFLTE